MAKTFPTIDPAEKILIEIDFSNRLATGESVTGASVIVTVTNGTDPAAASHFGTPTVSSPKVKLPVSGCLHGVYYHVRIVATTSNPDNTPVFGRTLPCMLAG